MEGYPVEGYSVSEETVNYHDYDSAENLVEELILKDTLDDEIKSVQIRISGYEERRDAKSSITVKLNK